MRGTERPSDDVLVAFLDGELPEAEAQRLSALAADDPEIGERIERLQIAGRAPIEESLRALLAAAPKARLGAMLDKALAATPPPSPARQSSRVWWYRPAAIAAAFAIAIVGGAVGYGLRVLVPPPLEAPAGPQTTETWLEAVAEYWRLTTPETLAFAPDADLAGRQLAAAGGRVGIALSPETIDLPGLSFRGAQIFDFDGRPLVQIAYLDPEHGPIAFCLIANAKGGPAAATPTIIDGFEVVHWQTEGVGRMVIGRAPADVLKRLADRLKAAIG